MSDEMQDAMRDVILRWYGEGEFSTAASEFIGPVVPTVHPWRAAIEEANNTPDPLAAVEVWNLGQSEIEVDFLHRCPACDDYGNTAMPLGGKAYYLQPCACGRHHNDDEFQALWWQDWEGTIVNASRVTDPRHVGLNARRAHLGSPDRIKCRRNSESLDEVEARLENECAASEREIASWKAPVRQEAKDWLRQRLCKTNNNPTTSPSPD